ncbi:VOC family protein [Temperatibacter marinus]|uniref:VOC family protein n=1 Tax=Temperatibacter marinus TaxID=1456591 RepID=A0AA52H9V6_9PROT|nr:VOC family protein [Temperatibacter marinus]WND03591.1 VOC family protein [Temperatibacter marinus]
MDIQKIHHVAYRCREAKETVDWYKKVLKMDLVLAIAEDCVPSTKQPEPYMHVFLDAGMGNILAFFELPTKPAMGRDKNTPEWVQHIAFEVTDEHALLEAKKRMECFGVEVLGPTDHGIFKSIYFLDPNGHRLELVANCARKGDMERLNSVAEEMITEWSRTKKAPRHAAWLHERELGKAE